MIDLIQSIKNGLKIKVAQSAQLKGRNLKIAYSTVVQGVLEIYWYVVFPNVVFAMLQLPLTRE